MDIKKYIDSEKIFEYKVIETKNIPFSSEFLKYCKENLCGQYNANWTCPPAVSQKEEQEKITENYKYAVLFSCKYQVNNINNLQEIDETRNETMNTLRDIIEKMKSDGISCFAYGCSSCKICKKCSYPDKPCRFPDKAIIPIEACGINVYELAINADMKYYNGENTITYFCLVVL